MDIFAKTSTTFARIIPQRDLYATLGLIILMLVVGIIIMWKMISYRSAIKDEKSCTPSVLNLINTLIGFSVLLIAAPLILIIINVTGNAGKLKFLDPYENVIKTQSLVLLFSLIMLILVVYLNAKMGECGLSLDKITWSAASVFTIGSIMFLGFRFYSDMQETKRLEQKFTASGVLKSIYNIGASGVSGVAGGLYSAAKGFGSASGISDIDTSGIRKEIAKSVDKRGISAVNTGAAALGVVTGKATRAVGSGIRSAAGFVTGY